MTSAITASRMPLRRTVRLLVSGVFSAQSGARYSIGYTYLSGGSSVNLTGSPDYAARIRIIGDPGKGCSGNQYAQFGTAAFAGTTSPRTVQVQIRFSF